MNALLQFPSGRSLRGVAVLLAGAVGLLAADPGTNGPAAKGGSTNPPAAGTPSRSAAAAAASITNAPAAGAPEADPPAQHDYGYFRIISERNIFNQNRRPGMARSGRGGGGPRAARFDSFTLVGTLSYGKGDVAIFDGSGSEYRKSLKPAGTIAGYKLTAITNSAVTLELAGKKIEMNVGSQMRREEGGQWELAGGTGGVAANGTNSAAGSVEGGTDNSADNSSSGAGDDVLQRLLKKREQELNNEKP